MTNLVSRLRQRLVVIPKQGSQPRSLLPNENITLWIGGDPKPGDDAGLRSIGFGGAQVQEHVWAADPLCEEAAQALESAVMSPADEPTADHCDKHGVVRFFAGGCPQCYHEKHDLPVKSSAECEHQQDQQPAKRKYPRWAICMDAIDDDQVGCVQILLPRWLSTIFLWWKLPKDAFRKLRALHR